MTDQINDQISAFIDNELSADESALLVRRFERDPEARARAMRYTLIGASMRGELLEPHPSVLRQRVAAALWGAPPIPLPKARERWSQRLARPLIGVGIAATVGIVAIGVLRSVNVPESFGPGVVSPLAATPIQTLDAGGAPSYVVPRDTDQSRTTATPRLTNYLMHHGEFASGLTRTSVHSNVVGASMEPVITEAVVTKPVAVDDPSLE